MQRELGADLTFEAGYLGSISRHLESYRGVSAAVPGPGTVASRSPYPNFGCSCWWTTAPTATTTRWPES